MHNNNEITNKDIAARRLWCLLLTIVGILVMSPAVIFGFELCDSGFYATFYDNIFHHPESVGYNFMYWLSGIAGGLVSRLGGGSLIWLRIAGLISQTVCIVCVWSMLSPERFRLATLLGTVTVCAGILLTPLSLYNDNLTAMLACMSLAFLCRGIRPESATGWRWILIAAFIAGLNTLTRLPNVLEFCFVVLIPLSGIRGKQMWRLAGIWTAGWASGLGAGLGLAAALGHLPLLGATVRDLFVTAATSSEESTHGLRNLISVQISAWTKIVILTVKLCSAGGLGWYFARFTQKLWLKVALWLAAGIVCARWVIQADCVTALASVALNGCVGNIFLLKDRRLTTASIAALLMMIILPLGSDNAIYNSGTPILWIGAATGMAFIIKKAGKTVAIATALLLTCTTVNALWHDGFYFDDSSPAETRALTEPAECRGIRTSASRATRTRKLLDAASRHITPGDTLLVYGSAPMLNHLTRTIPAIGCSWPELLTPELLENRLATYPAPSKVMVIKFNTLGSHWGEPSEQFMKGETEVNRFHNARKSEIILKFLEKKEYRAVAETADFVLYEKIL